MMGSMVAADDLTTLDSAKRQLGQPEGVTDKDAMLTEFINGASGWVRRFTQQPIRQQAISWSDAGEGNLMGNGSGELILPAFPVLALSALQIDVRTSGGDWAWTGSAETGALRYGSGPTKNFVLDQRMGIIRLTDGGVFPEGPYVRVDAVCGLADGTTDAPLPLAAGYPFSQALFSAAAAGGSRHVSLGWEGSIGKGIQEKVNELVSWMYRQQTRAQQGLASQSGGGYTVTYMQNVPAEIRDFFQQFKREAI